MKKSKKSYGYLCVGLHLGYAQADDGSWNEIVYRHNGSLISYPCNESDIDKNEIFDERILTASEEEVIEILASTNFVQMWQIYGQDALVETTLDSFIAEIENAENTDPRVPICIISGIMVGYWFDHTAGTFCRVYYDSNELFAVSCRKEDVETQYFLSKNFTRYTGTEHLRKKLGTLDFIKEKTLFMHDKDAELFWDAYTNA